ncbi:MAG: hypothetical protein Q9160_002400 [Pyrenula sp. 1 TL-2023]
MDICSYDRNASIGNTNITWSQAGNNQVLTAATDTTYLRPDTAGALLPWMYAVIVIVVHIPTVLIRVVKWERVQTLCLVLTFFTAVVYVQAYVSTKFEASKILVWTPVILIIDAGSMLQLFFLVIEAENTENFGDYHVVTTPRTSTAAKAVPLPISGETISLLVWYQTWRALRKKRVEAGASARIGDSTETELQTLNTNEKGWSIKRQQTYSLSRSTNAAAAIISPVHSGWKKDKRVWVAALSLAFFFTVLALQIIGLIYAVEALDPSSRAPEVAWCSTFFQPFGLAIVDGDCHVYYIELNNNKGIGCVKLPGLWQQGWIKATIAVLIMELVLELADLLILYRVDIDRKWHGAKMKRPWLSTFSGMIILLATLLCSIQYATYLPPKITERVMVLADVQGPVSYEVALHNAGSSPRSVLASVLTQIENVRHETASERRRELKYESLRGAKHRIAFMRGPPDMK